MCLPGASPSPSSSPSTLRAENLGKAFPPNFSSTLVCKLFTLGQQEEPHPSLACQGGGGFVADFRGAAFYLLLCPSHPFPPLFSNLLPLPCPVPGAGLLSTGPAFPSYCSSCAEHPLPEVMEIRGAGGGLELGWLLGQCCLSQAVGQHEGLQAAGLLGKQVSKAPGCSLAGTGAREGSRFVTCFSV